MPMCSTYKAVWLLLVGRFQSVPSLQRLCFSVIIDIGRDIGYKNQGGLSIRKLRGILGLFLLSLCKVGVSIRPFCS